MRIKDKFNQLKRQNKKAFIGYVPFGFPSPQYSEDIILSLAGGGIDLIEVGIPFSDPLADGPLIQRAAKTALDKGATLNRALECLTQIKDKVGIPVVVMTYYNPVLSFGMERFFRALKNTGVGGVMIVDLPIEESAEYIKVARKYNIDTVFFITPTTSWQRAKKIVQAGRGFIYYISVTGITGPRDLVYAPIATHIKKLKKITKLPICVGFGIHTKQQIEKISSFSDGVIMGSEIVKFIEDNCQNKDFLDKMKEFTRYIPND